jgi:tRNA-binding protein
MSAEITFGDFEKVEMRVGTVLEASVNEKARKPAYILRIDFGAALGVKTTSAQLTEAYRLDQLVGKQLVAVVNFPKKKIADVWSEVLVLGAVGDGFPVILLSPTQQVQNGLRIA